MSNVISSSLADLRSRKRQLISELNRVDRAIKALEGLTEDSPKDRRQKHTLVCQNQTCKKSFQAARSDAKYCMTEHSPAYIKRLKDPSKSRSKPTILIRGDNLSKP